MPGTGLTVRLRLALPATPLASVARAVNAATPEAVEAPVIAPLEESRASPAGSAPLAMLQTRGVVPPVEARVAE